jgi:ornithine carbamoyltransferase
VELSQYSGVPVINALSDLEHPTQAVSDLFTIIETKGKLEGLKLAYIGDGNNVCNSLLLAAATAGMHMSVACPPGYEPNQTILSKADEIANDTGAKLTILSSPSAAAKGADVLYTDVWVSMGEEEQRQKRLEAFQGYQINSNLLTVTNDDSIVMHCLPAHRGLEITDEIIEGPRSVAWRQGENKLYGAASTLEMCCK